MDERGGLLVRQYVRGCVALDYAVAEQYVGKAWYSGWPRALTEAWSGWLVPWKVCKPESWDSWCMGSKWFTGFSADISVPQRFVALSIGPRWSMSPLTNRQVVSEAPIRHHSNATIYGN